MQYFTIQPTRATAGSPPESTRAENRVRGNDDAEYYVEHMLDLLRTGDSPTSARLGTKAGWTLTYTGGVGDDEDAWITDCDTWENAYPGLHALLGVRVDFTDGPYGRKAGSVQ